MTAYRRLKLPRRFEVSITKLPVTPKKGKLEKFGEKIIFFKFPKHVSKIDTEQSYVI